MSEEIDAQHILIMHEGSPRSRQKRSKEEALKKIQGLQGELKKGADFAELARQQSDCPSSRDGGALGTFGRGMMVAEFEQVAFALDVGETSDVVETDFGFHLIHRTA